MITQLVSKIFHCKLIKKAATGDIFFQYQLASTFFQKNLCVFKELKAIDKASANTLKIAIITLLLLLLLFFYIGAQKFVEAYKCRSIMIFFVFIVQCISKFINFSLNTMLFGL